MERRESTSCNGSLSESYSHCPPQPRTAPTQPAAESPLGDARLAGWAPAKQPRTLQRMGWVLLIISRLPTPTRGQEPLLSTPILPSLRWLWGELRMDPTLSQPLRKQMLSAEIHAEYERCTGQRLPVRKPVRKILVRN